MAFEHTAKPAGNPDAAPVEGPDVWVRALAEERAGFVRSVDRKDMVIAVDEELAKRGWCVDVKSGELVRVPTEVTAPKSKAAPEPKESAVDHEPVETAVEEPAPKARTRRAAK